MKAVYVCGADESLPWDEPWLVMTDDGTHDCEGLATCKRKSRWFVEVAGWAGGMDTEPPYLHPVRYVCDQHIKNALVQLAPKSEDSPT